VDFAGLETLTEWVAYFALPESMDPIDNEEWETTIPTSSTAIDDLTFSWTISPQAGYTGLDIPGGDPPTEVPDWDNPSFNRVPEPSSALLLFSGAALALLHRKRKAA